MTIKQIIVYVCYRKHSLPFGYIKKITTSKVFKCLVSSCVLLGLAEIVTAQHKREVKSPSTTVTDLRFVRWE